MPMTIEEADKRVQEALAHVVVCEEKFHASTSLDELLAAEEALTEARLKLGRAHSIRAQTVAWHDPVRAERMRAARRVETPARRAQREAARAKAAAPEARKRAWETRRLNQGEQLAEPSSDTSNHVPG